MGNKSKEKGESRKRNLESRDLCIHVMGAIIGTWKQQKKCIVLCKFGVSQSFSLSQPERENLRETT